MYTIDKNVELIKNSTWRQWVQTAVQNNDLDALNVLYLLGGNILEDDNLIVIASKQGYFKIVKYLLDKGVDISRKGGMSLFEACKNGHIEIVELLCEFGADIDFQGGGPLRIAVSNGYHEIVEFLISKGADVTKRDNTPIHIAVHNNHTEIAKLLFKAGALIKKKDTLLCDACKADNEEMVNLLIAEGADVNHNAPLIYACKQGNINIVRSLIQAGANVALRHNLAIQTASSKGFVHIVEELIRYGANPLDSDGKAIKCAALLEELDTFKFYARIYKKDFLKKLIKDYFMTDKTDVTYCRLVRIINEYGLE